MSQLSMHSSTALIQSNEAEKETLADMIDHDISILKNAEDPLKDSQEKHLKIKIHLNQAIDSKLKNFKTEAEPMYQYHWDRIAAVFAMTASFLALAIYFLS
jgi:hypothetical protein